MRRSGHREPMRLGVDACRKKMDIIIRII